VGVRASKSLIDILTAAFEELSRYPQAAKRCDHIHTGYRCRRVQRHVVYCRTTDNGIAIIRILHERMDTIRHV